jgi:cytochrome c oxidase assembly protein subunit 15
MLAYLLVVLIVIWSIRAFLYQRKGLFLRVRLLPLLFVVVQLTLGIYTVLTSVHIRAAKWNIFEWMAQLHQFVALLLLLSLILAAFLVKKRSLEY